MAQTIASRKPDYQMEIKIRTPVLFRVSKPTFNDLDSVWRYRTRPDPLDPTKKVRFKSKQEFLNFVVRCCINCPNWVWYLFSNASNPQFPNE